MKLQIAKFTQMLKTLSIGWELNPLLLDFSVGGIRIAQADSALTNAVLATISPRIAQNYEPIGKVLITKKQVDMLKKMFKADEYVDFNVEVDKIILKGKEESLELSIASDEVKVLENVEVVKRPYGEVLAKPKVLRAFQVDLGSMRDIGYEKMLKFVFSDKLQVVVSGETYKYTRAVPVFKVEGDGSGEVTILSDLMEEIAEINDKAWLIFTEDPVEIYYECDDFKVLYVLSQVVL